MFQPAPIWAAAGPLGAASVMLTAIQTLYGLQKSVSDFLGDHIDNMTRSENPTISRTGRVLEAVKVGFGIGYIAPVVIIAAGQLLLGNTLAAVTTMATVATMTNPVAMTCAAVGAVYYGWLALNERERGQILEDLSRGLEVGIELIKSVLRFVIDKTKELLSAKNFEEIKKYVSSAAQVFGRGLGDVTRKVSDMVGDTFRILRKKTGEKVDKGVDFASDALDQMKEKAGEVAGSTKEALQKIGPKTWQAKTPASQGNVIPEGCMRPRNNIEISEPALLIRVRQLFRPGMTGEALYEVTRGVWRVGERREKASYALSVVNGIVQEVYAIHSWHQAGSTPYRTRERDQVEIEGRWEFVGEVAEEEVREKYLDCSVAHYFKKGEMGPVKYLNC